MSFSIDPTAYDPEKGGGSSRPDVRPGKKLLWCAGIKYGKSMAGNTKIDACFVVADDPKGGLDNGALVWDTFTLTQRAAWKLQQAAQAMKCKQAFNAEDKDETWDVFRECPVWADIRVVPKHNGDGTRGEVQRYTRWDGNPSDAMVALVEAADKWYREWTGRQSGTARRSVSAAPPQDDDIPF